MDSGAFTITGPKGNNQDTFLEPTEVAGIVLTAVADGLGGHADGKLASETAITALRAAFSNDPTSSLDVIISLVRDALREAAEKFPLASSMGTTLSLVRINGRKVDVGHVGDSRIYHIRARGLLSRTVDQTEVAELVRQNVFTPQEAQRYPRKNVLLSSLSPDREYDLYKTSFEVIEGDTLVLCTDGLYNTLRKRQFVEFAQGTLSMDSYCEKMRVAAEKIGIKDDATLVALRVD